ncbi:amidinotransferase [Streptomyces sp. R302]|uniref:arginine deiminase family protein n=1 Tax=unclassified Streptomyces TaxID=2593676 RepID=UPI00145C9302|nr:MULTISPECIES: arginine deiminase family protein [unclassified Streptomyces]NML52999.1 amidinotransferase [Streptomyces sp. R301]NML78834.1 amidinotransferase [Streptomyces sp. R302]
MSRVVFLIQNPADVMPAEMALFMGEDPPYDPGRAAAESAALKEVLVSRGAECLSVRQLLTEAPREALVALATAAVGTDEPDRWPGIRAAFDSWSGNDLADIVIRRPHLRTHADPELAEISPDAAYESYEIRPLFGLMFPRDHYVDLGESVALGRLRRQDRARETAVVRTVLEQLRGRPAELTTEEGHWLEGGDAAVSQRVAVLGGGFRSSPEAMDLLRGELSSGGRAVVSVRDGRRRPEEFHLDHWLALGPDVALVAEDRLDDVDVSAVVHRSPDESGTAATTLREALHATGVDVIPLSAAQQLLFAANSFFLPDGRTVLTSTAAHKELAPLLEPRGIEVVSVPFDNHHKLFGSVHCALNTVTVPERESETS